MKRIQKTTVALFLACLIVLVSCRSLDNEGGKDWVTVEIKVDQPSSSSNGNRSVSPSGTHTALITAIPATSSTVTSSTDLSGYYDQQLQNVTSGVVTLLVPLNEEMQLVKKTYSDDLSLAQAGDSDAFTAFGASEKFTVTGSETTKTVTISLTLSGTTTWTFVDGDGSKGINKDTTRSGLGSDLTVYTSTLNGGAPSPTLFIGWSEESASLTSQEGYGQIRVAGWNGSSSWTFIDGNGADGINKDVTKRAEHVDLIEFDSKLYVAFGEYDATYNKRQIRVKAWDGYTWEWKDGGGVTGLNKDGTLYDGRKPKMVVFDSKLFIIWNENSSGARQVRVRQFDGSTWSWAEPGDPTGINYNTAYASDSSHLVVLNSKLYAVWNETTADTGNAKQVRVAEWDGSTGWTFKDGNAITGLSQTSTNDVEEEFPLVFNSKLYITWGEKNASNYKQLRVIEWDGVSTWQFVDGNGADGLNKDVTKQAASSSLFVYNSKLHVAWAELDASSIFQLRVSQWDGSSTWSLVGGSGTSGLNKDSTKSAVFPISVPFESGLFMTFFEGMEMVTTDHSTTDTDQIRVMMAPTVGL